MRIQRLARGHQGISILAPTPNAAKKWMDRKQRGDDERPPHALSKLVHADHGEEEDEWELNPQIRGGAQGPFSCRVL